MRISEPGFLSVLSYVPILRSLSTTENGMNKSWLLALVPGLLIGATGCPDIDLDTGEVGSGGPVVEFDPSAKVIPFPNNLLIDPMTGLVNIPPACNESATAQALREGVLNTLDGFGTYEVAIQATFTQPVDMASLTDNVVLYKRASGGMAVDPSAAQPVPTVVQVGTTARSSLDCQETTMVSSVIIIPQVPLDQKSTYTVALLSGIKDTSGVEFGPSFTWALISQAQPPVVLDENGIVIVNNTPLSPLDPEDLASLQGIAQLWAAEAQGLAFLEAKGINRSDVLLSWEFNTQTTTDPLDPAVAGSPASAVTAAPLQGLQSIVAVAGNRGSLPYSQCDGGDDNTQCYLKIALGAGNYAAGEAICVAVECQNVGDVLAGAFPSKQYQVETPNPFDTTKPIPGAWDNPYTPTVQKTENIGVLVFVPAGTAPAGGFPAIVFGHGLGSDRRSVFAIAPQLAKPNGTLNFPGYVTVAMDFVAHGSRAVRISNTGACADSGTPAAPPDPTVSPQCYAPFLSPNLAGTRDNIRQSVLDLQGLTDAMETCGTTMCTTPNANLKIDPAHIEYAGISLGGIIGSMNVATKTEIKAGLLNVAGAGWVDIFENTQTLAITCSLVDGLIDAGILVGEKWNPVNNTGLCTTDAWKMQPGYRQFSSVARWVLDPADPANFSRKLIGRKVLLQEVVGDTVVPNIATDRFGALMMLPAMNADPATMAPPFPPSAAITTNPTTGKFVKYMNLAGPPPNDFVHSSLLRPAPTAGGTLGTARLQTDAITYLILNR
ncbi:MAG: Ig-like domain-containing protein [Kofleriaceae bacterium]|nr:Ig-like domain-containing protein [Kofleriaceae bacterium]